MLHVLSGTLQIGEVRHSRLPQDVARYRGQPSIRASRYATAPTWLTETKPEPSGQTCDGRS
jgi:hypothetical protein